MNLLKGLCNIRCNGTLSQINEISSYSSDGLGCFWIASWKCSYWKTNSTWYVFLISQLFVRFHNYSYAAHQMFSRKTNSEFHDFFMLDEIKSTQKPRFCHENSEFVFYISWNHVVGSSKEREPREKREKKIIENRCCCRRRWTSTSLEPRQSYRQDLSRRLIYSKNYSKLRYTQTFLLTTILEHFCVSQPFPCCLCLLLF